MIGNLKSNLFVNFINIIKNKLGGKIKFKKKIQYLKDIYLDMIGNLTELNFLNYYKDVNYYYSEIILNMNELKTNIDLLLNETNINKMKYYKILVLREKLITLMKYVTPKDINIILKLYNKNWRNIYNSEENNQLDLYINYIRPIYLCDTNIHKIETNLITPIDKKDNNIIKNIIIQNIINSPDNKDKIEIYGGEEPKVNNIFEIEDCVYILCESNIVLQKNKKAISLIENKYGCSLYVKIDDNYLVIQGIFKDDLFNISLENAYANKIINNHINSIKEELTNIPSFFYESYFEIVNLRDKLTNTSKQISEDIKKKYNDFKNIQSKPLMLLINEFLLGSKYRKIDILTLFLISNEEDHKIGYILFDIFKSKDKKNIATEIYNALHYTIRKKLDIAKINIEIEEKEIINLSESDIPYERRISILQTNLEVKSKAMEKLKAIKSNFQGDSKAQNWLDGLLKIPFNVYSENYILSFKKNFIKKINVDLVSDNQIENYLKVNNFATLLNEWINYKKEKVDYLRNVRCILDNSVYGHKEAKMQIERIFAQWINGENKGAVLGLHGPPGTGKTSLIKNGLSKCLKDSNGNARPFVFLPIGGSVNGSTLVGHNYTYVGSTWGRIVDILMSSKCMNPIIFIDELDKISNTEFGREIISILTHLTDSTQNDEFEDKFFSGIKLDLSKALIIFSFNDISLIDYILRDRITVIETHPLKMNEKITIIKNYILPDINKEVGFSDDEIIIDNSLIEYIIETYTLEAGVRKIKEKIVEIIREINVKKYFDNSITFPFTITKQFCDELFELKPKVKIKKIKANPAIGIVNGLYASSSSVGGITFIQAIKYPSDKLLELNITGLLGDSMKESVQYSLKLAFSLLSKEIQDNILNEPKFGIHLHCPDGAVKKDGPSGGAAITLALYSLLINKPVNNKIALTGEIDLVGNITAIGGLETKINGAKKAGVELVLFPEENMEDIEIMRKESNSPEDDIFKIMSVNNIHNVLKLCLIS
jgi:ATP-dependent Lon protease